jgi:periplasmic divalent cation tolerance protein
VCAANAIVAATRATPSTSVRSRISNRAQRAFARAHPSAYPGSVDSREPEHAFDDDARRPCLVLITAPDARTAEALARRLVDSGAAACVNVIAGVKSIYRWQGRVEEASEALMIGKTTRARASDVEAVLAASHPYQVPECVFVEPARVEAKYLAWLLEETRSPRGASGG